jgi:hypothetical protein
LNVFQSVEERNPFEDVPDCVIDKVLFALRSPPPCKGAVVDIVVDVGVKLDTLTPVSVKMLFVMLAKAILQS